MADRVEGIVDRIHYSPASGTVWFTLRDIDHQHAIHCRDSESELYIGGCRVTHAQLLEWLSLNLCRVVLYPRVDRYGAALKAEFTKWG